AHGGILLEATRSANDGALIGVAGNAYVTAVREAFAGYTYRSERLGDFTGRIGILPTLAIPAIEEAWRLRAIDRTTAERAGFEVPADVGAIARWDAPKHWGTIGVGFFNGEGYTKPELNRGKDLSFSVEVHPLAPLEAARPLAVFFGYTNGSIGTASS